MQGEYTGKPIFRRRYVGMDEDAIRDEINRLQDELYTLEETLDFIQSNDRIARQQVEEAQIKNERLLKQLDDKFSKLQRSIDYEAPIKSQIEKVATELREMVEKSNKEAWNKLVRIMYINTMVVVALAILIVCSIFIF